MTRTLRASLLVFLLFLSPAVAYANAGTPLMWAGMLHLVFGNAIIGLCEGLLIAWVFKCRKRVAIFLMILANYFSAWVGGIGVSWLTSEKLSISLYQAWPAILLATAATFIVTVILELPFVVICLRKQQHRFRRSFLASLMAQAASYFVIVPWFLLASGLTLVTKTDVDRSLRFIANPDALVYFISTDDGNVYRARATGQDASQVFGLHSTNKNDRLFVRPSADTNYWDLYAFMDEPHPSKGREVLVAKEFSRHAALSGRDTFNPSEVEGTWFNFGPAADLRPDSERTWTVSTGFWAIEGLYLRNTNTEEKVHLALETPFLNWPIRNATVLPGDEIVFQLDQQICIYNRKQNKLGLIMRGRGPVVALENSETH